MMKRFANSNYHASVLRLFVGAHRRCVEHMQRTTVEQRPTPNAVASLMLLRGYLLLPGVA